MTEDELIMATAIANKELRTKLSVRTTAEAALRELDVEEARQRVIDSSLLEVLKNLLKSKIVMISEYRSLLSGRKATAEAFAEIKARRAKATQIKVELDREIPVLRSRLAELEKQLDAFEPPAVVLEFKREQHRDPPPSGD